MSYKIAIGGDANSGKSYSRRTIRDGDNVFVLQPSVKAAHLFTGPEDARLPVKFFDLQTKKGNVKDTMGAVGAGNVHQLINYFNEKQKPGSITKENLKGNVQLIKEAGLLSIWLRFINDHLPWIHTVIISDFTHFISRIISDPAFINRKAGGEAYQRYLELAAEALRNFIIDLDEYRDDLIIVTEYHTEFVEYSKEWQIFTPGGKMLTEKFKPESYYDIFPFTDIKYQLDNDGKVVKKEHFFVTERTPQYPLARGMNLFAPYIPNDLQLVLDKTRGYLGMDLPK